MIHHYNKLIRDKTPDNARRKGNKVSVRSSTTDTEYWYLLKSKLQEEVTELGDNPTMEKLVDVFDVLDAIIDFKKYEIKEFNAVRENKMIEEGKFSKRLVLEKSEREIGHPPEQLI